MLFLTHTVSKGSLVSFHRVRNTRGDGDPPQLKARNSWKTQVPQHSLEATANDVLPEHCSTQRRSDYALTEPSFLCKLGHCTEPGFKDKILPNPKCHADRPRHPMMILIKIYLGPCTVPSDGPPICSHLTMASPRGFDDHVKHYRTQRQCGFSCSLFYLEVSLLFLSCRYTSFHKENKQTNSAPKSQRSHHDAFRKAAEIKTETSGLHPRARGYQASKNLPFIAHHSAQEYLFTCNWRKQAFLDRALHTAWLK